MMFEIARLKLTAWYLLIIMTISLAFSLVIYRSVTFEFQRRLNMIEARLKLEGMNFRPGLKKQRSMFLEDFNLAKLVFVFFNVLI